MPVPPKTPGVYIEEMPAGVPSIAGASTSTAAFVGWAPRGDVDRATLVRSWSEYERHFGGLDIRTVLGHCVAHFFANGGRACWIVRLVAADAPVAAVVIDGVLRISARNPGGWASDYAIATRGMAGSPGRFTLTVERAGPDGAPVQIAEQFAGLSMGPNDPRFVVRVLERESGIVRAALVGTAANVPRDTALPSPKLASEGKIEDTVLMPNSEAFETALAIGIGKDDNARGIQLLQQVDLFNLLCVPGETTPHVVAALEEFCREHRAFLIVDSDANATVASMKRGLPEVMTERGGQNAALYFPWIMAPDPLRANQVHTFPPCGAVAGVYARTDLSRGVWKAPAGADASLAGIVGFAVKLSDADTGVLNPQGINCLRILPARGPAVWGSRTVRGGDQWGSEWKYVPVRRMALYIEESLRRGMQWAVFERNAEPLWAKIRLSATTFMHGLYLNGALQGSTPREAFFVKCDAETTTEADRAAGVVNIVVGFAPLKPSEFVIVYVRQTVLSE